MLEVLQRARDRTLIIGLGLAADGELTGGRLREELGVSSPRAYELIVRWRTRGWIRPTRRGLGHTGKGAPAVYYQLTEKGEEALAEAERNIKEGSHA